MAQDLSLATRIGTDSNYLNGNLVLGTLVGPHINQDIVQFFQKLMASAGLTPNDLDDNETNDYQFITAALSVFSGGLTTKKIDLDAWDMYFSGTGSATYSKAHGLSVTEWKTIRSINVFILNNAATFTTPLNFYAGGAFNTTYGGVSGIDATNIGLGISTISGHPFDQPAYSGSGNRGYMIIEYIKD